LKSSMGDQRCRVALHGNAEQEDAKRFVASTESFSLTAEVWEIHRPTKGTGQKFVDMIPIHLKTR
jgi:hypothetical protein